MWLGLNLSPYHISPLSSLLSSLSTLLPGPIIYSLPSLLLSLPLYVSPSRFQFHPLAPTWVTSLAWSLSLSLLLSLLLLYVLLLLLELPPMRLLLLPFLLPDPLLLLRPRPRLIPVPLLHGSHGLTSPPCTLWCKGV